MQLNHRLRCAAALLFFACLVLDSKHSYAVAPGAVFTTIGNAPNFKAFGVSANGQYVVGSRDGDSDRQAFRWDESTGITLLGDLPGGRVWSEAQAVANNGLVVGDSEVTGAGGTNPFRWDPINGMVSLGTLGGSEVQGFANDISANGTVVVGMSKNASNRQIAYRWTLAGGMVPLGTFGSSGLSEANGISSDGTVIVGSGDSGTEGWYWTAADGFRGVGRFSSGGLSVPRAASANGAVIVGDANVSGNSNRLAFDWRGTGTIETIGDIPNATTASVAYDVSGDGNRIVGTSDDFIAVIWERINGAYQIYDLKQYLSDRYGLSLPGWQLQQARSISTDGLTIVGYGVSPDGGGIRGWRVTLSTPVPEPENLAGFAVVLVFAINSARHRQRRISSPSAHFAPGRAGSSR
jgi:probable HAF family extracellular repeat protein